MKIEIDDDTVDTIIQGALVNDYVNLTNDLKNNVNMHEDDALAFEEAVEGIEILGRWYFAHGEFEKAVKKERKARKAK